MLDEHPRSSPPWSSTTKLVVSLTLVAIIAYLLIHFRGIIVPLLLAFVLAYLLSPVAGFLQMRLHLSWGVAVGLIYLLLLIILLGSLTLGGLGLVPQVASLVTVVQVNLASLPGLVRDLSGRVYQLGPFQFDVRQIDPTALSGQLLGTAQSVLGRTGTLLSAVAGGAAQFIAWGLFVLVISYFVLSESGGLRGGFLSFDVPGYSDDIRRMGTQLSRIWNAFLRGQIIIFILTVIVYTIVFSVLGVHYAIGIAILAGFSKFVPYVGPFITWTTLALVAYFQPNTAFGLSHFGFAVLSVGLAVVIDQTFDNIVSPRIIGQVLRVHPAAVLVAAFICANLLGLLGIVLAAPMLATVLLVWRYMMRKMLDLDPWPAGDVVPPPAPGAYTMAKIRRFVRDQIGRLTRSA
ncbi:MAG TPA: AI-2E family transporter [Anaerolineales bacterium]|nr:AI-2E family transporter [Anaerolineales bacterium]